jgi:small subunit ribosomal protein S9
MPAKKTKKEAEVKTEQKAEVKSAKYFYAVGRRKTSVAQVRLYVEEKADENVSMVNNKKSTDYFPTSTLQTQLLEPIKAVGMGGKVSFSIHVNGGGFKGQTGAAQLGIARALVKSNEAFRKSLKDLGFLTRDARKVERKKPGLKKARKSPQWAKR